MVNYPLSYRIKDNNKINYIKSFSSFYFYNLDLSIKNPDEIFNLLSQKSNNKFLIKGVYSSFLDQLHSSKYDKILLGKSADINIKEFLAKKSLTKLYKRAEKKVKFSIEKINQEHLDFVNKNEHKVILKYLFRENIKDSDFITLARDIDANKIQAIISSSIMDDRTIHLEKIIRLERIPAGTMEFLVMNLINEYKAKYDYLSLGEVPFHKVDFNNEDYKSIKKIIIKSLCKMINFLASKTYNTKNLYDFKNKFEPKWSNVYWVSSSNFKISDFIFMFYKSNYLKLILNKKS